MKINSFLKKTYVVSLIMMTLGLIFSCTDPKTETPSITLSQSELTVSPDASEQELAYTLSGVSSDSKVVTSSDADWVSELSASAGKLRFKVAENPVQSPRTAHLKLFVERGNVAELTLIQEASEGPKFNFAFRDLTSTGVTVDVLPSDKSISYTWNIMDRKYAEENFKTDDALALHLLDIMNQELEDYKNTVDASATLESILSRADDMRRVNTLEPNTEYLVVAFGVDAKSGSKITKVSKATFTTAQFKVVDNTSFNVTFEEVKQLEFTFTVTPSNPSTRYFVGIYADAAMQGKTKDEIALEFIRGAEAGQIDWTLHSSLSSGMKTINTSKDMNVNNMEPNTAYTIMVFGVSTLGERTTEVFTVSKMTAAVPKSSLTFRFNLYKQTESGAVIDITPSNEDEEYMAGCIKKSEYDEKYRGNDEFFTEYVMKQGNVDVYQGDHRLDRSNALISDTDYICFAFGYQGGATTKVFTYEFHTGKPEATNNLTVSVIKTEIKDGSAAGYDGRAIFYAFVEASAGATKWNAIVMPAKNGVPYSPVNEGITYNDTEILNILTGKTAGTVYSSADGDERAANICDWDAQAIVYAIAYDADGGHGPLMKKIYDVKKP